jgi:hypothetical protein
MRKTVFTVLIIVITKMCFAQSFQKGNRNLDLGFGLAGCNGTVTDNQSQHVYKSGAKSFVISPQISWGVWKVISLGASLSYGRYLDSTQSKQVDPKLNGLDGNFILDLHFIRKQKMDVMLGMKLGIAGLRYNPNDGTGDIYGSLGTTSDLHCNARFYVSEKIGIIATLALPRYLFTKFGKNTNQTQTIMFGGLYIGTGLAINLTDTKESSR